MFKQAESADLTLRRRYIGNCRTQFWAAVLAPALLIGGSYLSARFATDGQDVSDRRIDDFARHCLTDQISRCIGTGGALASAIEAGSVAFNTAAVQRCTEDAVRAAQAPDPLKARTAILFTALLSGVTAWLGLSCRSDNKDLAAAHPELKNL